MSLETCIILNPAAKGERAQKLIHTIKENLPDVHFMLTSRPGHARELAQKAAAKGFTKIIAAGGDGTLNEVVNGMIMSDATLGILPVGSVNVFALELGIPRDFRKALEILQRGNTRKVDVAKANDRWFVQLGGVGLDAQIVKETQWELKKQWGPLSYAITASKVAGRMGELLNLRNGSPHPEKGSFMLVGNGRYYGGPFHIFPEADLEDGLLDVCLFENMRRIDVLRYIRGILCGGTHINFKDVHYFKVNEINVSTIRDTPVEVDGELHGTTPVQFSIEQQALNVIAP
ncbi:MAG: diacylglycerol kinase family protein [Verrucomicrobiota bacterium]